MVVLIRTLVLTPFNKFAISTVTQRGFGSLAGRTFFIDVIFFGGNLAPVYPLEIKFQWTSPL